VRASAQEVDHSRAREHAAARSGSGDQRPRDRL